YATSDLVAEMTVTGAKLDFIYLFSSQLRLSSILLEQGLPPTICLPERSMKNPFGKLPDFDDIHCNEKIDFTVVGFGSWGIHCNTTVMNINPLFTPVGIGFSFNTKTNEFLTASVSVSKGPGDLKYEYNFQNQSSRIEAAAGYEMGKNGPIEIGAKFTTAIEFDRTGITDINSGVGVEASVGNKVGGIKVESSSSIGWNAGVSNVTDEKISGLAGDIMKMYRGK
ncbi:MAG: hypothetical protein KDC56_10205, partial [Flavobacteriaceae bacterium]|nr:hypothetical protein [Flavobacteriaceae bacterium]